MDCEPRRGLPTFALCDIQWDSISGETKDLPGPTPMYLGDDHFRLEDFHVGVYIPEFKVLIPWLIAEAELYRLIPYENFYFSRGAWPMLRCTLIGLNLDFGFNFVTDPGERLLRVQYSDFEEGNMRSRFCDWASKLKNVLPKPDHEGVESEEQIWHDNVIAISHSIHKTYKESHLGVLERDVDMHCLEISYSAGWPSR
jgi:hypothetical protein